ncbi:MAG: sulfate transporter CysZ [Oceanicoccus sp.]|uniref:sulfate transporter CysZ n=1 Tax=Oceanicoccus sp. TaxID=2691044 RepID=UPI002637B3FF|nr:sulfate transporter CysZ [Oceanicoccus sp.]MDG1773146.1 sulfate transporter CysZ [Oceanicoccus sp.]
MKGNPVTGFNYLIEGFKLITQPGLRLFVLIPLAINSVIFSVLITLTIAQFSGWIEAAMEWVPDWLSFIRWVLWPLVLILILTVVMYTFSVIANILASPFNALLAEKTEEFLTGKEVPGFETIGQALLSFPKSIGRELAKLIYYIPLALLVLIISFIPLINALAPMLWFLLGSWMMVIQYCDYPMDNHQVSFRDMKQRIKLMRLTSAGFGASVMVGTMIPLVNLIIMPAAVCGATAYWAREMKKDTAPAAL